MVYKNVKTGFMFESQCEVVGADWVKIESAPIISVEKKEEQKPKKKRTVKK